MSNVSKTQTGSPLKSLSDFYEDVKLVASCSLKGTDAIPKEYSTAHEGTASEIRWREQEAWRRRIEDQKRKMEGLSSLFSDSRREEDVSEYMRPVVELLWKQHAIRSSDQPYFLGISVGTGGGGGGASGKESERLCGEITRSRRLLLCRVR